MALILHSSSFATNKPNLLRPSPPPHNYSSSQAKPRNRFTVKSQDSSSSTSNSSDETITTSSSSSSSSTVAPPTSKKPNSGSGLGFGSSTSTNGTSPSPVVVTKKKQQKGKKEKASIIRRTPVEKPSFALQKEGIKDKEQEQSESAFLLAWLGLGGIILVQGIALSASGFLPEEWDTFLVKYIYPSFTPTVFLFVAGTVVYGVLKYLQNERFNSDN